MNPRANQYASITTTGGGTVEPLYDSDGSMKLGPLPATPAVNSTLRWDAEHRLIEVLDAAGTTSLVKYTYDAFSRLVSAAPASGTATLRVYDGWNPIAEYAGQELGKTYLWGMDLSGTMQGAGGVGGLLAVRIHGTSTAAGLYHPTYDGNGNVSEYLTPGGSVAAHYEYDPFGNDITPSNRAGTAHNAFAHRFSTKPVDPATGLYYYGYRFYDPLTGRWPSRDPIEEEGGLNLYGFVGSGPTNSIDPFGLVSRFTVVHKKSIPLNTMDSGTVGKGSLDGFEVRFEPDKFYGGCCDSIKLVQAIARHGIAPGLSKGTKIDCDNSYIEDHKGDPGGMPLPDYVESGGRAGDDLDKHPHSYIDAPFDITQKSYTLTVCAFCHRDAGNIFSEMDVLIGCITFHFDQKTRRAWTDIGKSKPARGGEDGFEADAESQAGDVFNEALKNWGPAPGLLQTTTPDGPLPL